MTRLKRLKNYILPSPIGEGLGVRLLLLTMLFSSCNLFIEDEYVDENGFKDVPVHEGNGYDEPVTMQQGEATVTYQYKKNVRVITPEQQKQWVVYAEKDATGAFIEVHFRDDTPADILPVPGEILVSTVTDFFPWGCNHLLQRRDHEDGKYIFQGTFCTLEDTFDDLKIDGQVTDVSEEEYYAYPVSEEKLDSLDQANGVNLDSIYNNYEYEGDVNAEARARAERRDLTMEVGGVKVTIESGKFGFKIPLTNIAVSKGPLSLCLDMNPEKNFYELTTELNFDDFDLSEGRLKAKMIMTTEQKLDFGITGSVSMPNSQRLHRWEPMKGKVVVIGPVVIVFFINIDLELQFTLDAAINVTKHNKTRTTYTMDFKTFSLDKDEEILTDEDWGFGDLTLSGNIKFIFKLQLCMGIYGKILSVRVIPTLTAEVNFALPQPTFTAGEIVWDISRHEGVTFRLYFSVTLGVFLDLSLKNLIGNNSKNMSAKEQRKKLKELEQEAKSKSEYFQDMSDELNNFDPNKKYYVNKNGKEKEEQVGDDEIGISHTFGPWQIIDPPIFYAWYPTTGSSTFTVKKQWNEVIKEMSFTAEYKIYTEGLLSKLGVDLVPALQILNGPEVVAYSYPKEGGQNAKVEENKVYQFPLLVIDDGTDVVYTIKPCFFYRTKLARQPAAVDKGIPYAPTSPAISITDLDPTNVRKGLVFYDDTWNLFEYDMNIIIAVKGGMNISEFGFNEANYIKGNVWYNKKDNGSQLADGRYLMKCTISYETKKTGKQLKLLFKPFYKPKGAGSHGLIYGQPWGIIISSDKWFQYYNVTTGEKGESKKFSPMMGGYDGAPDDNSQTIEVDPSTFREFIDTDDGRVKITIKSIEDEKGEVIWKRDEVPATNHIMLHNI